MGLYTPVSNIVLHNSIWAVGCCLIGISWGQEKNWDLCACSRQYASRNSSTLIKFHPCEPFRSSLSLKTTFPTNLCSLQFWGSFGEQTHVHMKMQLGFSTLKGATVAVHRAWGKAIKGKQDSRWRGCRWFACRKSQVHSVTASYHKKQASPYKCPRGFWVALSKLFNRPERLKTGSGITPEAVMYWIRIAPSRSAAPPGCP